MRRITVPVKASDPLVHAGIGAMLRACAQIDVLGEAARDDADVVVLAERVVSAGRLHAIVQRGDGKNVDEIATRIGCPEGTIRKTLSRMMRRLNLNNHSHAVAYAFRSGALT